MFRTSDLHFVQRLGVAVLLLGALGGCAPYFWGEAAQRRVDDDLEDAKKPVAARRGEAVPEEISRALLPPIQVGVLEGGPPLRPERFDLTINNAPVRQVFMGLVEGTPYSMVLHPDVAGTVSLNLKNVTLDEALDAIREAYAFEYKREGNRYFILGPGMQTRIFPVNYLNVSRAGKSDTRVSSGELNEASSGTSGTSGSTTATGTTTAQQQTRLSNIQVQTQSQADFWKELSATLTALVGNEGGRRVVVNSQAGLVVVRALPEELRLVENFLGATHATINRQVILEAKILEVELKEGFQSGVNWSKLYLDRGPNKDRNYTLGQIGGGTIFGGAGTSDIAGNTGNLNPSTTPADPIVGTASSAFGGVFTLAVQAYNFSAFIELLKTQGDVNVLSSPRVSTVNNQKAVIKVGSDEFFVTGVVAGTTSTTGTTTPVPQIAPFFSGVALDVTPQIDENDNIVLHIHPAVTSVTQQNKNLGFFSQAQPLALSSIQESDSIVRTSNSQIIVIGGLMKEGATDEDARVPVFGDIPFFGNLFKHKKVSRIRRELVILLRPTIVDSTKVWTNAIEESQERIRKNRGVAP